MRRLFVIGLVVAVLLAPVSSMARSRGNFASGVVIGMAISGGNQSSDTGTAVDILYLMPRAVERIKDPLALQVAKMSNCHGLSIRDSFHQEISEKDKNKEIVQVLLMSAGRCLEYVFIFTDRSNLVLLENLPNPVQK